MKSKVKLLFLFLSAAMAIAAEVKEAKQKDNAVQQKILIISGHPDINKSKANKAMLNAVRGMKGVKIMDIHTENFSVNTYRKPLEEASVLVLQFPFYFGSAPAGMKRWLDEIFFQLELDGVPHGKTLFIATTAGGPYEYYQKNGDGGYTMKELLSQYEITSQFAKMKWTLPFVIYSSTDDAKVKKGAVDYKQRIASLLKLN